MLTQNAWPTIWGGAGSLSCPVPSVADTYDDNYNDTVLIIDATGQSDGTSYATEESPSGLTITYINNATVSSGKFAFDGASDALTFADSDDWTPSGGYTWEFFGVQADDEPDNTLVLAGQYDGNPGGSAGTWWLYWRSSDNALVFTISQTGAIAAQESVVIDTGLSLGTEYDVYASWDGAAVRLYLDGVYKGKITGVTSFSNIARDLYIGCERSSFGGGIYTSDWQGSVAAIRLTQGVARYTNEVGCAKRYLLPLPTTQTP